jgi:hypothetical protein
VVGAAAVAGGVAAIVPLLQSPPPAVLAVRMGSPEWAAQDLTLGSYMAWQQRESGTLGLRAVGGGAAAQVHSGEADHADVEPTGVRLAAYASPPREASASSAQSTSTVEVPTSGTGTTSAGGSTAGASGASSGTGSSPSSTTSPTELPWDRSSSATVPTRTLTGSGSGSAAPLRAEVLRETQGQLDRAEMSRLQRKVHRQEAILHKSGPQPSYTFMSTCQGVGYGGCAPEATAELRIDSAMTGSTGSSPPGRAPTGVPSPRGGAPLQNHNELLRIADGARLGRTADASLIPPLMTAGLSASQRARVASMLGDAVSFNVHTQGWIGQQLLLTWTMYEKQEGHWNPSSREYLIDHAEAYLVPTASEDEGILTFWFPIPKQPGDYQVRYFIRAPRSGLKLASGKTPSFRS